MNLGAVQARKKEQNLKDKWNQSVAVYGQSCRQQFSMMTFPHLK